MSIGTRSPIRMAGAVINSGDPNDGAFPMTYGGARLGSFYSGALAAGVTAAPGAVVSGAHALIISGAGRLSTVQIHQNTLTMSGVPITFYDSAVIARSGTATLAESGARILTSINRAGGVSGQLSLSDPIQIGMPFQNGLCVSMPSGSPGFSFSYTPEALITH